MSILHYQRGCIRGTNVNACQDLKISGEQILENWWRKEGHRIDVGDVTDILAASPEVVVVGTGYAGFVEVSSSFRSALTNQNIQLIAKKTAEAVKTFNQLHSQGKRVAGAFHLTC